MNKNKLHIIGVGTSGSLLTAYFKAKGIQGEYSYINDKQFPELTDAKFIEFIPEGKVIPWDGLQIRLSNMDAHLELPKQLTELLNADDKYVLLTALGGYTGTFVTEGIADFLSKNHKECTIFCYVPFDFEGKKRIRYANTMKEKLEKTSNFHCLPLNYIREKYGNLPIQDAFEKADEELFLMFKECWGK